MDVRHEACFVTTPYGLFCPVLKGYYHAEKMLCIMIATENVLTLPDKQKNCETRWCKLLPIEEDVSTNKKQVITDSVNHLMPNKLQAIDHNNDDLIANMSMPHEGIKK